MTDDVDITAVWHVKASWSGRASTGFGDDDESGGREAARLLSWRHKRSRAAAVSVRLCLFAPRFSVATLSPSPHKKCSRLRLIILLAVNLADS